MLRNVHTYLSSKTHWQLGRKVGSHVTAEMKIIDLGSWKEENYYGVCGLGCPEALKLQTTGSHQLSSSIAE